MTYVVRDVALEVERMERRVLNSGLLCAVGNSLKHLK